MLGVDILGEGEVDVLLGPRTKRGGGRLEEEGKTEELEAPPVWERAFSISEHTADMSRRVFDAIGR